MQPDTIDKIALGSSGAAMLTGIVLLGIVEIIAGQPYGASPVTNDAGEVVATPFVDPTLRTALVILGLVILGLYGVYRMAAADVESDAERTSEMTAD